MNLAASCHLLPDTMEEKTMKQITDFTKQWAIADCSYPGGINLVVNGWDPQDPSTIWNGVTEVPEAGEYTSVDLPHIWNVATPNVGAPKLYRKEFNVELIAGRHYFVSFNAVSGFSRFWLNGQMIGEHKGGYQRFVICLDSALVCGKNELIALVDNTCYCDICTPTGDFNKMGGIYRGTDFVETDELYFDITYYGTKGLEIDTEANGMIHLKAHLSTTEVSYQIEYRVIDMQNGEIVASTKVKDLETTLQVTEPKLWNGRKAPNLYKVEASLFCEEKLVDKIELITGFRAIRLSSEEGFFLNGEHLRINGVAKHQDREGKGWNTTQAELEEDMELIKEVGANAIRLSHYQHPDYFYDLCDKEGMVTWAEIPMLFMPDGNDAICENAHQQMKELILQNKHHPSICFWGIQNEIAMRNEGLEMYRKTRELNELVKELLPESISASANMYTVKNHSEMNFITDMQGYNIYYGWYYGEMSGYGEFMDAFHKENPEVALGISEYGVDASTWLHSATPKKKDYSEEFQSLFHETVYPQIEERPWLWGSFIWNMFEFASAHRNDEAGRGLNRKGIVTYDRKTKKDAFYYYKACWNPEPMIHVNGRRFVKRHLEKNEITVYSNMTEVSLYLNGELICTKTGERVFKFEDIYLKPGMNTISAKAGNLMDEIVLEKVDTPEQSYIYIDPNPDINVKDWYTADEGEEAVFPKDKYSLMDEMKVLAACPEAWNILVENFPDLPDYNRAKNMPMTLLRTLNRVSGKYSEQYFKDLNNMLTKISKN